MPESLRFHFGIPVPIGSPQSERPLFQQELPDDLEDYFEPRRDWSDKERVTMITRFSEFTARCTDRPPSSNVMSEKTSLLFLEKDGRVFDLCSLIPPEYTFHVGMVTSGIINHESRRIDIPLVGSKSVILGAAHEIGHAHYVQNMSATERHEYDIARRNFRNKRATPREREIKLADERAAWQYAREVLPKIHDALGASCFASRNAVEAYIGKCLKTYEDWPAVG